MNKFEFKYEQLEKEMFMLKQELEFREMETAEYREREVQLKRMNQSLMKALEQQKPNNPLLTEIKLMVEQYGGGERQKALELQLDQLRKDLESQVSHRVKGIVDETHSRPRDCTRCKQLQLKYSELELEYNRVKGKVNSLNQYIAQLQSKYRQTLDQLQVKQTKLLDVEMEFKRFRDNSDRERENVKSEKADGSAQFRRMEVEFRQRVTSMERNKEEELGLFKKELERNFERVLSQKVIDIGNQYEQQYQQRVFDLEKQQRNSLGRKEQDPSKRVSRMTPVKTLRYTEHTQVYAQPQEVQSYRADPPQNQRPGVSPAWRKQNRNGNNANTMCGQIQEIISGLAKNRHQQLRGGESQLSGYPSASHVQEASSQYSNFSIKQSIIRPNGLVQNHMKLKTQSRFY